MTSASNLLEERLQQLDSGDDAQAEGAIQGLVALGKAAHTALLRRRRSPNLDTRWWAYRALAAFPYDQSPWLRPGLQDDAAEIRQVAALGLAAHPNPKNIPLLVTALDDKDPMAADLAMQALIRHGKAATDALLNVLPKGQPRARLRAIRALAAIADPASIPALMRILENDSALMQYWADRGLDNLGLKMLYFKPE
jgi:HEAT repeat protein